MATWIIFTLSGRRLGTVDAMDRSTARKAAMRMFPTDEIAGIARDTTPDKTTRLLAHQDHSWRVRDELVSEIGL